MPGIGNRCLPGAQAYAHIKGVPRHIKGVRLLIKGVPRHIKGVRLLIKGVPRHIKGVRLLIKGVPRHIKGVRLLIKGVPRHIKGVALRFVLLAAPYLYAENLALMRLSSRRSVSCLRTVWHDTIVYLFFII